jgi:hypothetical protein
MYDRDVYVIQPYRVGTKDRKSLAIVIPAQVVKEYSFNTSTVFALNVDKGNSKITLRKVGIPRENPDNGMVLPTCNNDRVGNGRSRREHS